MSISTVDASKSKQLLPSSVFHHQTIYYTDDDAGYCLFQQDFILHASKGSDEADYMLVLCLEYEGILSDKVDIQHCRPLSVQIER